MNNNSFKIIATKSFLKNISKFLEKKEFEKFEKFKERLKNYPYLGDSLRVPFVREFKTESGKRIYFLVYEEIQIILFVSMSNKKDQNRIIQIIFENLKEYKLYVYNNLN